MQLPISRRIVLRQSLYVSLNCFLLGHLDFRKTTNSPQIRDIGDGFYSVNGWVITKEELFSEVRT
jgi:hypothetical protein